MAGTKNLVILTVGTEQELAYIHGVALNKRRDEKMTKSQLEKLTENHPLAWAVICQLGYGDADTNEDERIELGDTLKDVARYGAISGFGGFTYYSDTNEFAENNERAIMRLVYDFERETGQTFGDSGTYRDTDRTTALNWLAWFALESVAHEYDSMGRDWCDDEDDEDDETENESETVSA
jgi:hypothetical protein